MGDVPAVQNEREARDAFAIAQFNFAGRDGGDLRFRVDLHPAGAQLLVGVASEFFADLGQDVFARMDEHDA